jgi:DNA-binding NarL/FixJ family response regulator
LQTKVTPQTWQTEWDIGRNMTFQEAVEEALIGSRVRMRMVELSGGSLGLTSRETDVLRLLVEGRSDREIGEELYISTRTAQGHVSHIFDKLGVNSRAAAVALAVREGIT